MVGVWLHRFYEQNWREEREPRGQRKEDDKKKEQIRDLAGEVKKM